MIINRLNTIFLVLVLFLTSCARISSPQGGLEDLQAPQLVRSVPDNGQVNFQDQKILLVFDEIVATNQIESNLIITPRPEGSFRTRSNRNTVELTFSEPFADSTTYTFSFANTIQDVTAQNPAENLSLSFSTGTYLDSLQISGQVLNLYDQLPSVETTVSLFAANDSLNVLNGSAQYYARTDSAGKYTFRNLPPNGYRVYAFQDKNNNNKADSDGEFYGFYPDTIQLSANQAGVDFTLQKLSTKELRLLSSGQFGKYFELTFNKAIIDFEPLDDYQYTYSKNGNDKIRFYKTNELYSDTTQLIFQAKDSVGNVLIDTAAYYFIESDIEPDKFKAQLEPSEALVRPSETVKLIFNKPISRVYYDSIQYSLDSLNVFPIPQENIISEDFNMIISWPLAIKDYAPRPDQKLTLTIKKGAFFSIEGDTSSIIKKTYEAAVIDETAQIFGNVANANTYIIVQLLNSRTLEVIEETTENTFEFSYLNAGSYMIRVINDLNGNGVWDTGNIIKNEVPEPATFYVDQTYNTQLIEVRKNWAVGPLTVNLR